MFDSSADFLAAAGADENAALDVTRWITLVVRRNLAKFGASAVVLDHTPKNGSGARGSGAKKAKPEVAMEVTVEQPFSRHQVGRLKVELDKDREGYLPFQRHIRIGTDAEGFVLEELPEFTIALKRSSVGGRKAEGDANRSRVLAFVEENPGATVASASAHFEAQPKEAGYLSGKSVRAHLDTLVEDGTLRTEPGPRGAKNHYIATPEDCDA